YTYGDVNKVRLISPRFDIVIAITSLTNESVTIADVLGINSNDINNINSIDQLQIRLGKDFNETISVIGDGNRTPIVSKFKTSAITIDDNLAKTLIFKQVIRFKSDNVRFSDTVGNYRLKDNQYVTIETPKPSFTKPGIVLKDTKSFVSTPIVIQNTASLIFGSIIDIGGISRTTSTFLNYYLNDNNTFRTISSSGITTLYFTATISLSSQTFARVLGFRNLDGVEGLFYDVTLPILNLTTQSVSVAYLTGDFKFKVQLGKIFTLSGATYQTYPSSQFNIPRLNQQTFLINNPIGIDLLKTGKLGAAIKLAATTSTLSASRYKSEIVIRGEGRPIPQRTTNISTASNIVYESYLYNIYGKNATSSTAISWYLSENNIISTIPRGTSLITLYLGSLPQYYFPNGNFVRIVAPLGAYDLVHP
ncbi:hypothetical protein EBU71_20745, partial [bacterium]|nr:hypothetical protein [Candidatus Elulimicrobium humile]